MASEESGHKKLQHNYKSISICHKCLLCAEQGRFPFFMESGGVYRWLKKTHSNANVIHVINKEMQGIWKLHIQNIESGLGKSQKAYRRRAIETKILKEF